MIYYHGQVYGPAGQFYQCEHNHRTETAAVACANSSATRQMASMAWSRAATQAAHAAAEAKRREDERLAAQERRAAAQAAQARRQEDERAAARAREQAARAASAARQAAAERAKAAKRAAKLAAMPPERAWKQMTEAERQLKIADMELEVFGEVVSPEALAAHVARGGGQMAGPHSQDALAAPRRPPADPDPPAGLPDWLRTWLPAE